MEGKIEGSVARGPRSLFKAMLGESRRFKRERETMLDLYI